MKTVALYRLPGPDFARAVLRGRGFEVEIANVPSQLDGADFVLVPDKIDAPPADDRITLRVGDPTSALALVRAVQSVPRHHTVEVTTRAGTVRAAATAAPANDGLVRERQYKGNPYRIEVVADGYRVTGHNLDAQTFRSPSAAAFAVTNISTNGWTFWDLPRKEQP